MPSALCPVDGGVEEMQRCLRNATLKKNRNMNRWKTGANRVTEAASLGVIRSIVDDALGLSPPDSFSLNRCQ